MGLSGLGCVKGRPEQLLQVLAELKELHFEDWEAEDRASTNTHTCVHKHQCMHVHMYICVM